MQLKWLLIFSCSLAFSGPNHQKEPAPHTGDPLFARPEQAGRTISDPEEALKIKKAAEEEGSEWAAISCAKEGCTYQRFDKAGAMLEEVFIPSSLKTQEKPKSAGESESHESDYPALNTVEEYEAALQKAKANGQNYLLLKFGAPNHNCLSCLRFDKFLATPEMKKFLGEKKVGVYTTDVGEFTNPDHAALAKKLGAQVANQSFHIPYVAVVDLQDPKLKPQTLINGYFNGMASEREAKREMKRIQRVIP